MPSLGLTSLWKGYCTWLLSVIFTGTLKQRPHYHQSPIRYCCQLYLYFDCCTFAKNTERDLCQKAVPLDDSLPAESACILDTCCDISVVWCAFTSCSTQCTRLTPWSPSTIPFTHACPCTKLPPWKDQAGAPRHTCLATHMPVQHFTFNCQGWGQHTCEWACEVKLVSVSMTCVACSSAFIVCCLVLLCFFAFLCKVLLSSSISAYNS